VTRIGHEGPALKEPPHCENNLGGRRKNPWVKCANCGTIFPCTDQHQVNGRLSEGNLALHDGTLSQTAGRANGTFTSVGKVAVSAYKTELHWSSMIQQSLPFSNRSQGCRTESLPPEHGY